MSLTQHLCQMLGLKKKNRTESELQWVGDNVGTPTADLLLINIFLNSVISTKEARFANADISNFYLGTPLLRPEYTQNNSKYKLHEKATPDGCVYIKVSKGMYGLPQASSLAHDLLEKRLNKGGYFKAK
ncbi:hypothetical protein ACHAW6_008157 [Cyclotella cf. meneghiniana]